MVEIIFKDSSKPKQINAEDVYTKGGLLCIQCPDGLIIKYPLINIFSVCSYHSKHLGTNRNDKGV